MSDGFAGLDAVAQAELVRRGEVSPAELVDAAIERAERLDPELNAIVLPRLEQARERARAKDLPQGPFRGVPYLMKDCGGGELGEAHHVGMRCLKAADWREPEQSHYADAVRQAGMVPLGRSNTPELALLPTSEPLAYGATRNPWSLGHSAGGSSGGSAAAVAAGIVAAAHASDGGGSIRGPASKCGLVGLKPTRGRNSFGPAVSERWSSFSAEHCVTRSVRDTAALLDVFAGARPGDPYTVPPPERPFAREVGRAPGRLKIALFDEAPRDLPLHPECQTAVRGAAASLEALGHDVELAHPPALQDPAVVATYVGIVAANIARSVAAAAEKVGREIDPQHDIEPLTAALAERGRSITAPEHLANIEFFHRFGRRLAEWWNEGGWDLLLTPTQAEPPAEIGFLTSTPEEPFRAYVRSGPYGVFTLPYNLSGQPAISLPMHMTAGEPRLPVGVQLVAPFAREDLLIRVASQLEQAEPWAERRPPIFG